jgi:NADH dehydrogenase [ubiquinone] 1 alpha subcomplex assembly factor 3
VVNSVQAEGAVLCLPDTWLLWDVQAMADITPASLAILDLTDPPPEVLVVGCGAAIQQLPQALQQHLRARGIAYEVLDTVRASPVCRLCVAAPARRRSCADTPA